MADDKPHEIDGLTGMGTTGHEWDGIRELNSPLPRWWLWLFYATIVWAVGYWLVYPSWPLLASFTPGALNWYARSAVVADLEALKAQRAPMVNKLAAASLRQIVSDPVLLDFAQAQGRQAFAGNCAPCHGAGGGGAKGYPNLNDDDWLWGGKIEQIMQTIEFGARSGHPKAHESAMLAFGRDGILKPGEIVTVANYVRSLSGLPTAAGFDAVAGHKIFAENCVSCHGDTGKGNQELGAPNLTDKIWLYGSDEATVIESITNGRGGVMPAWSGRLDPTTIKALAIYVHSLGGGQ
jgi:cytochrome c oxidase cbb3-type subunit III